jgi:hypothetical protein
MPGTESHAVILEQAILPITDVPPHPKLSIRRYIARGGAPAEPVELFGRIAAAGIRLHYGEGELLAEVPQATSADRSWPTLDRRVARYAGSLALTVSVARRFAAGRPPEQVVAMLAELRAELPEILVETLGGEERLAEMIAEPRAGAEFDLACVACCRGLAIRTVHRGQSLAGVLLDGEDDHEDRERQRTAAAASRRTDGREAAARGSAEYDP